MQSGTPQNNEVALQTVWFCLQSVQVCTYSRTRLTDRTHWPGWTRRTLPTDTKQAYKQWEEQPAVIRWTEKQQQQHFHLHKFNSAHFRSERNLRAWCASASLTCSPFPPLAPFWPCSPTSPCIDKVTAKTRFKQSSGMSDHQIPIRTGWNNDVTNDVLELLSRITGLVSILSGYSRWSGRTRQTDGTLHSITTGRADRAFLTLDRRKRNKRRINTVVDSFLLWLDWQCLWNIRLIVEHYCTAHWIKMSRILTGTPFSPEGPGGPWGPGLPGGPTGPAVPAWPLSPGDPYRGTKS